MTIDEFDALPKGSVIVTDTIDGHHTVVALRGSQNRFPWHIVPGGGPHSAAELIRRFTEDWTVLRRGRP